jgi:lipopolysaccharide/colanic/teichoic acid biosynthesis glycosyltransferase
MIYFKRYKIAGSYLLESLALVLSFSTIYHHRFGTIFPWELPYDILFIIYLASWLTLSAYYKKYSQGRAGLAKLNFKILFSQSSLMLLILTLFCSHTKLSSISRQFLLYISLIPAIIEYIIGLLFKKHSNIITEDRPSEDQIHPTERIEYSRIIASSVLLIAVYSGLHYSKLSSTSTHLSIELTIIILFLTWVASSSITGKFKSYSGHNIYNKIVPYFKSSILMILFCSAAYYFGRIEDSLDRYDLFVTAIAFSFIEFSVAAIYFNYLEISSSPIVISAQANYGQNNLVADSTQVMQNNSLNLEIDDANSMIKQLKTIEYDYGNKIQDSIISFFAEKKYHPRRFKIFYNRDVLNIQLFKSASRDCLLNYYPVNDIQNINNYFKACYNAISVHGYLIGIYEPQEFVRLNLEKKMPRSIFVIYFPFHYFFKRLLPKLPLTGDLHNLLTRGKNRLISKAEFWGRLAYAGFSVSKEFELNGKVLFIAQKSLSPSLEKFPSYGPLIKLRRTGLHGKMIRIYKLRTMYPFSEFIQREAFEQNSLDRSGKIKNDFRRTGAGKMLRKIWLDELPQLFNWVRGDISLVGVRALSDHFLSLYPADIREMRMKFKPGILPPYYADMPKSLEEVIESERRYLERKTESPFLTDVTYLYKIIVNIIIKGARSG